MKAMTDATIKIHIISSISHSRQSLEDVYSILRVNMVSENDDIKEIDLAHNTRLRIDNFNVIEDERCLEYDIILKLEDIGPYNQMIIALADSSLEGGDDIIMEINGDTVNIDVSEKFDDYNNIVKVTMVKSSRLSLKTHVIS